MKEGKKLLKSGIRTHNLHVRRTAAVLQSLSHVEELGWKIFQTTCFPTASLLCPLTLAY